MFPSTNLRTAVQARELTNNTQNRRFTLRKDLKTLREKCTRREKILEEMRGVLNVCMKGPEIDYLTTDTLQHRYKTQKHTKNIKKGPHGLVKGPVCM